MPEFEQAYLKPVEFILNQRKNPQKTQLKLRRENTL